MGIKRYVFIVTYGRSGSTILQKIIGKAPGFYIAGENKDALFGLYDSCRSVAFAKRHVGGQVTTSGHTWYGSENLMKLLKFLRAKFPREAVKEILATKLKH